MPKYDIAVVSYTERNDPKVYYAIVYEDDAKYVEDWARVSLRDSSSIVYVYCPKEGGTFVGRIK